MAKLKIFTYSILSLKSFKKLAKKKRGSKNAYFIKISTIIHLYTF